MYPLVQENIARYQNRFYEQTEKLDKQAAALYAKGQTRGAIKLITEYTVTAGDEMTKQWLKVWMKLFATIRDG